METGKVAKRSNTPLYIIIFAILLIVAGVVLIVTGNNKSFLENKKTEKQEEKKQEEKDKDKEEIPNKSFKSNFLSDEEALALIKEYSESSTPEITGEIRSVEVVGSDENGEKFLVNYEVVSEDETVITKQTIISSLDGNKWVDWPGWTVGERDLTVYNFSMIEDNDQTEDIDFGPIDWQGPELSDDEFMSPSFDE